MYFEKFRPMNSRMQTFEYVGLLILHDLDLRSNERLSVDFYTPVLILYYMDNQQLEALEKPMHVHVWEFSVCFCNFFTITHSNTEQIAKYMYRRMPRWKCYIKLTLSGQAPVRATEKQNKL